MCSSQYEETFKAIIKVTKVKMEISFFLDRTTQHYKDVSSP